MNHPSIRVLHVCSEIYPLLKTGGLADVTAALPPALNALGCDGRMLVPGFPDLAAGIGDKRVVAQLPARFGVASIALLFGRLPNGVGAYVIDAPLLYNRPGNPYADAKNQAYPDNYKRFGLLAWVAAQLADGLDTDWQPQIVHGHDWHAGLVPAYLKAKAAQQTNGKPLARSVSTIHNLAYQGNFPREIFSELGLPAHFFGIEGLEFHHQVSYLKAALAFSDKITTVSPTYAREIQQHEQGCGLDGMLRKRSADLTGILNGVDPAVWNPMRDPLIPAGFEASSLAGKAKCKATLQRETGLAVQDDAPLFCVVSRLTEQKGLHLVLAGLPEIVRRGGQLVLLGNGDAALEAAFREAAQAHPQAIAVRIGYDEEQAHRIIAGSDVILVPSRFEPCGLTQLYGLTYGTLPLVHRVGGLADTVTDCSLENLDDNSATGFVFDAFDQSAYDGAIRRAFVLFQRQQDWAQLQQCGMQQSFSWEAAARQFMELYRPLVMEME